jgi:hypothetical protein
MKTETQNNLTYNKNKSAFPAIDGVFYTAGLTKREYFAMAAMQGILANRELQECLLTDTEHDGTTSENCYAVFAVKQADELLKHLES